MKPILLITCIFFLISLSSIGQQKSETNLTLGINKTSSPDQDDRWDELSPTYLLIGGTKSWFNNDHRFSLRKEAGLNLQYAHIDLSNGGMGAGNHYTGNIISLFANICLQARLRITKTLAFGLGPEAEILLIGLNNLNNSYYTMFTNPYSEGDISHGGLNRDYFNKPSYGIKLSLYESKVDARTSIALNFSYLWTQNESSDFYASNYTRITFVIGFKKKKDVLPLDPSN